MPREADREAARTMAGRELVGRDTTMLAVAMREHLDIRAGAGSQASAGRCLRRGMHQVEDRNCTTLFRVG